MTKKKPKIKKEPKMAAFLRLTSALSEYLEAVGWSAVVVGRPRVQKQPLAREFNYEFVVDFTGGKKKDPT